MPAPRALVSVSEKSGLASFAHGLADLGFEIVSTGGTARFLETQGLTVTDVAAVTRFPEMMGGRIKTLHPLVFGGLLGRPNQPGDAAAMAEHGITPFTLVVCNLYPFEQTVAAPDVTPVEAIEQIDVGGPSMVRAAAKNHAHLAVVTDPAQYDRVLAALHAGCVDDGLRWELAAAAFALTARYDAAIAAYFADHGSQSAAQDRAEDSAGDAGFPESLSLSYTKRADLRYGENPHQAAAFYAEPNAGPVTLAAAEQLHGKELSYNNLLDLDAALLLVRDLAMFDAAAVCVLKHNNPCGCALGGSVAEAFEKAWAGDPVSAFGSVLGFTRPVDAATADALCQPGRFVEAILAPGFEAEALDILTTKPAWRANVRLMRLPGLETFSPPVGRDLRPVTGGLLAQERDIVRPFDDWRIVTQRTPTPEELTDLRFAWIVCRHVKSNAIVFAKGGMTTGVGAGQMSRLDSARIAAEKSGDRCRGGVCASDAFFPFRDGVDAAAAAGIAAIVQPGGSKRDDECIAAADQQGLAMAFTARRHFRH